MKQWIRDRLAWIRAAMIRASFEDDVSWRVVYPDGSSYPLYREDAEVRCRLYGGLRVEYCRDAAGEIIPLRSLEACPESYVE